MTGLIIKMTNENKANKKKPNSNVTKVTKINLETLNELLRFETWEKVFRK